MAIHRGLVLKLVCVGMILSLMQGCTAASRPQAALSIPVTNVELSAGLPTALHVENAKGSIVVRVNPLLQEPTVYARWNNMTKPQLEPDEDTPPSIWIAAETEAEGRYAVLRVLAERQPSADPESSVDLFITMPRCDGVVITNAGGRVKLVGVSGAIQVESGLKSGQGGTIEVRTDNPVTAPVLLSTSKGNISLHVSTSSTGQFNLSSAQGKSTMYARNSRIEQVHFSPTSWTGTLNAGTNPVRLQTGRGSIRVVVVDRPEAHTTSILMR